MAPSLVVDPSAPGGPKLPAGAVSGAGARAFTGLMLPDSDAAGPYPSAFLSHASNGDNLVLLSRLEELSTSILEGIVPEDQLLATFPIDTYWTSLRAEVVDIRRRTGNVRFSEHFQQVAQLAAGHRKLNIAKAIA